MYSNFTTLFAAAQSYSSLGFQLIPIHSHVNGVCTCGKANCTSIAKHPRTIHGVKDATSDEDKLREYFSSDNINIAVATGETSGVFALDVDDLAALQSIEKEFEPLPKTWKVQTGNGGYHLYFRFDDRCKNLKNAIKFRGSLDVRTANGYVLLPPSKHKSGNSYKWIIAPDECELADAPDWLLNLIPKHGETHVVQRAKTILERAAAYLQQTPPAISGKRGHDHTFGVVCRVCELFGELDDNEILEVLSEWNISCSPPWSEKDLCHKLKSARSKVVTQQPFTSNDSQSGIINDWPSLDDAAYHGIIGEIIKAIEPESEADPVGILVTLLSCLGSSLGTNVFLNIGAGVHSVNLFVSLVGDTASGKGQAWDVASKLVKEADPTWGHGCISYGLSSGEGLVERVSDPVDDDGSCLTLPPLKRLLCLETEFSRPITAMRREGNTLSPLLRSAWDRHTLEIMTRGKSKLRASNAFVSIVTHITSDELKKLLNGSIELANGFSNRFLWCLVRSSKSLPNGGNMNVLKPFIERLKFILEQSKSFGELKRTKEADVLWANVYDDLKASRAGAYGKAIERARPQVVRLSLLYAAMDCSPFIDVQHLKAALAVWNYCDDSTRIIFGGVVNETSGNKLANRIREIVKSRAGITRTDLRLAVSHSTSTEAFDMAIRHLIDRSEIVAMMVTSEAGRSTETFYPGVSSSSWEFGNSGTSNSPTATIPPNVTITNADFLNSQVPNVIAATLAELFDWRNSNSVMFERRDDGVIWVTADKANLLTSAIEAAIRENQHVVSNFVESVPTVDDIHDARVVNLTPEGEALYLDIASFIKS